MQEFPVACKALTVHVAPLCRNRGDLISCKEWLVCQWVLNGRSAEQRIHQQQCL